MDRIGNYKLPKNLYDEIVDYCELNELVIEEFIDGLVQSSFTMEKYQDFLLESDDDEDIEEAITEKPLNTLEKPEEPEEPEVPIENYKKENNDNYEHFD